MWLGAAREETPGRWSSCEALNAKGVDDVSVERIGRRLARRLRFQEQETEFRQFRQALVRARRAQPVRKADRCANRNGDAGQDRRMLSSDRGRRRNNLIRPLGTLERAQRLASPRQMHSSSHGGRNGQLPGLSESGSGLSRWRRCASEVIHLSRVRQSSNAGHRRGSWPPSQSIRSSSPALSLGTSSHDEPREISTIVPDCVAPGCPAAPRRLYRRLR